MLWDAIPDADLPARRDKVALDARKWNKDIAGTRRMDLGDYNYGIQNIKCKYL